MKCAYFLIFILSVNILDTLAKQRRQESVCARRKRYETDPMENLKGTIKCSRQFSVRRATRAIKRATEGPGTDVKRLMEVLTNSCLKQRYNMRRYYRNRYRKDLVELFKSETNGNVQKILVSMVMRRSQLHAHWMNKAMKGLGTDEKLLLNIMLTMEGKEMKGAKLYYKRRFQKWLVPHLKSELRGGLRQILIPMVTKYRYKEGFIKSETIETDIQTLEHPVGQSSTQAYAQVLTRNSFTHLRKMVNMNESVCESIEKHIEKYFSHHVEDTFKGTLHYVVDSPGFFARLINECIRNTATHDDLLVWILVSRAEIDLESIKGAYRDMFNHDMQKRINDDVSGTYKDAIDALLNPPKPKKRRRG